MLNRLVIEVTLDRTRVFASAGKLKGFGVAQNVRMHRKVDAGHFAGTSDDSYAPDAMKADPGAMKQRQSRNQDVRAEVV